jgi:hypothetical protein
MLLYIWSLTLRTTRGSGLPNDRSTYIYDQVPQAHLALYSAGYDFYARESLCSTDKNHFYFPRVPDRLRSLTASYSMCTVTNVSLGGGGGGEQKGREADHSLSSDAGVYSSWYSA